MLLPAEKKILDDLFVVHNAAWIPMVDHMYRNAGTAPRKNAISTVAVAGIRKIASQHDMFSQSYQFYPHLVKLLRDEDDSRVATANNRKLSAIPGFLAREKPSTLSHFVNAWVPKPSDQRNGKFMAGISKDLAEAALNNPNAIYEQLERIKELPCVDSLNRKFDAIVSANFVRVPGGEAHTADWYLPSDRGVVRLKHAWPINGGCQAKVMQRGVRIYSDLFNGQITPEKAVDPIRSNFKRDHTDAPVLFIP